MSKHASAREAAPLYGIGKLTRHIFLCLGPDCCDRKDGEETWDHLKKRLKKLNLAGPDGTCFRTKADCLRVCADGPIAVVYPEGAWYQNVTPENADRIIDEHLVHGRIVDDLCFVKNPLPPATGG